MPRTILPVPAQFSQGLPSFLPLPLHFGQMSSRLGLGCGVLMRVKQQPPYQGASEASLLITSESAGLSCP